MAPATAVFFSGARDRGIWAGGAATSGCSGEAVGPMHVISCMCTGTPYKPYLEAVQRAVHGLFAQRWILNTVPAGFTGLDEQQTFHQPVVPA